MFFNHKYTQKYFRTFLLHLFSIFFIRVLGQHTNINLKRSLYTHTNTRMLGGRPSSRWPVTGLRGAVLRHCAYP